jgi:hypothetical protein
MLRDHVAIVRRRRLRSFLWLFAVTLRIDNASETDGAPLAYMPDSLRARLIRDRLARGALPREEASRMWVGKGGGVHRGPDLQPRRIVRALYLKALSEEGELALPLASSHSSAAKRKRAKVRYAAVHNARSRPFATATIASSLPSRRLPERGVLG